MIARTTAPAARRLAVALVLPLLLTACAGEADPAAAPSGAPAPTTAAPAVTTTAPASPDPAVTPTAGQATDEESADVVSLTVVGGKVSGDTGRARVALGSRVRLTVTSDVADEIHVHGYDLYVDTAPGQPAQTEFVADKPGIFEVELHDAGLLLTRLQVQ